MRYGVCAGLENASAVKATGFDYIEMTVVGHLKPLESEDPTPRIKRQLHEVGISCESMNVFLPGDLKVTGPSVNREKLTAYIKTAGERAERLGVKVIVFGSGAARKVPDGFPRAEAKNQILWFLKMVGEIFASHELTLAIEPLNQGETNIINSVAEGASYCREVGHPSVKLLADAYHMALENEPWENLIGAGDLLVHAHLAEPTERKAPSLKDYDYRPFLGNLKAGGYRGRVSIEANWDNLREQGSKALEVLRAVEENC